MYHRKCFLLYLLVFLLSSGIAYAQFTPMNIYVCGVYNSCVKWGDYDNDGDLDFMLIGAGGTGTNHSIISTNNGDGTFTSNYGSISPVAQCSAAWGDYDNDGDLDIILTGYDHSDENYISKIYRNNGGGIFTDIGAGLIGVASGSVAWGDYDNDGDLDILLTGLTPYYYISKIYRNNGNSTFTDIAANLTGVAYSSVAWGDCDNDGDLDILLTGRTAMNTIVSIVYRNKGDGLFTDIGAGLSPVKNGSVAWGDYDNDGDLDILLTGLNGSISVSNIYRNEGNGEFDDIAASLANVYNSAVAWGDYDNDGDLDILLTGISSGGYVSKIYRNNGRDSFTAIVAHLTGVGFSSAAWGDYDNDGDLDIILTGYVSSDINFGKIYRNDVATTNIAPSAPTSLRANIEGDYVKFHWDAAIDDHSPTAAINYVLKIGTRPAGIHVSSPMANDSGYRLIPIKGYVNSNCSWRISWLALQYSNAYYWSVQAIDTALAGSAFSPEAELTLTALSVSPIADFSTLNTYGVDPFNVQFTDNSVPGTGSISSWVWDFGDGGQSTLQNPLYTYNTPGSYAVSLTVTSIFDFTDTKVRENYITVIQSVPAISLMTSANLFCGNVYVAEQSENIPVSLTNCGTATLEISGCHFMAEPLHFQYILPERNISLQPGQGTNIQVRFTPQAFGSLQDTLYIMNDSVNNPLLKISLSGIGIGEIPMPPTEFSISMNDNDVVLHWTAVTENTFHEPLIPDCYFVFCNAGQDIYAPYTYLGSSTVTNYTHSEVGQNERQMMYRVKAIKLNRNAFRGTCDGHDLEHYLDSHLQSGMTEHQVSEVLGEIELK